MNKSFLWGGAVAANQYEGGYQEGHKGKILDCVQTGYTLNDKVLRHAKVVVGE